MGILNHLTARRTYDDVLASHAANELRTTARQHFRFGGASTRECRGAGATCLILDTYAARP